MRDPSIERPLVTGIDALMHDIKQPLLTISRLVTVLHEEVDADDGGIPDHLMRIIDRIGSSCDSVLKMIGPLLQMAILGDCEEDPEPPSEFDLADVIEQAKCNVTATIERFGGEIEVHGQFPSVIGNESRWVRVFQNMMKNGLKYNDSKVPTVKIVGDGHGVLIMDNGIGIPRDRWEDIFALSFRLHEDGRFGDGTGAGLYISRKFVEWDGGSVRVIGSDPDGTTFRIDLPEEDRDGKEIAM